MALEQAFGDGGGEAEAGVGLVGAAVVEVVAEGGADKCTHV